MVFPNLPGIEVPGTLTYEIEKGAYLQTEASLMPISIAEMNSNPEMLKNGQNTGY